MPKRGLGRGLEAILGATVGSDDELRDVPVSEIYPNPHQPRTGFDPAKLEELAASIKEHGVVQPILVRPFGDRFELVAGERRWRAAQLAGLRTVPAIVRSISDQQSLEIALVENLQREDLNPIEEAKAYRSMVDLVGLTQEEVAQRIGISRPAVSNALRLLSLSEEVQALLAQGVLSAGHARTLVGLPETEQERLAQAILVRGLNVRQTEDMLRDIAAGKDDSKPARGREERQVDPEVLDVERRLRQALSTKVRLLPKGRGGKVVIEFFSSEELDRLLDILLGDTGGREAAPEAI